MEQRNKFQKIAHNYRPLSYYIIGIILALPLYTVVKTYLLNNSILITGYSEFLTYFSEGLTSLIGFNGVVDSALSSGAFKIDTTLMALWQTILFVVGLFLLPLSYLRKGILLVIGLTGIVVFNTIRIVIISCNAEVWHLCSSVIINNILVFALNVAFVFLLLEWFKNHYSLKKLLLERIKIPAIRLKSIVSKVIWALFAIIVINFITNTQFIPLVSYLAFGILKTSEAVLNHFGYVAEMVNNRTIQGPNAGIYFSDSCLGLELMLTFAAFIAILDGRVWNKIWYITLGLVIIYMLNIARITLIFMHLVNNQGNYKLAINYHDIFTYPVYIIVFIMWVIWINRYNKNPDKL